MGEPKVKAKFDRMIKLCKLKFNRKKAVSQTLI